MSEKLRLYSKAAKSSLENAEQWLKDAKLLMKHGSFGHASALLRFAVEESVKALACWSASEKTLPMEKETIRDVFRFHAAKNEIFLGFLSGVMLKTEGLSGERVMEAISELSEEEISNALEELRKMVTSTEKMRQKAIYVNLKGEEVVTPLEIGEEESKNILWVAKFFLEAVRYLVEELPEVEKTRLRELFSERSEED